jgi:predicted enzyme related to lactoylglutathione lyase
MDFLVNLDVDDLDRAVAFYRAAFGLHVGRRFAFGVEMLGGPAPIYLLANAAGTLPARTVREPRSYDRHWTPLHLDFVVDDIAAAVATAVSAGARVEQTITTRAWGKLALLADPFGHGFCFVQFIGRGYDAIAEPSPAVQDAKRLT